MRLEEVRRKAKSAAVRLSSGSPARQLPGLASLSVCPAQLAGTFPADVFEGVETEVIIGEKQARSPLHLMVPVFIPAVPLWEAGREIRLGMAYGASLAQTAFGTGEGGALPEEREISRQFQGKFIVSWSPARFGATAENLRAADALLMEFSGSGRGCTTALQRAETTSQALSEQFGVPPGFDWVSPPSHLDMEFPDDLKLHVSLLRELTDHRLPVIVKLGAARVYDEVKLAVESGADAVWVEALESPLYGVPEVVIEELGVPLLAIFAPARKAFEETGAREKGVRLLVSGGISDGADVFKAIALGADAVGVAEGAGVAARSTGSGGADGRTVGSIAGTSAPDSGPQAKVDWKAAGRSVANYIAALTDEAKLLAAATGHTALHGAAMDDLRALTYDAAALTGAKLAGYDRSLPMWMH